MRTIGPYEIERHIATGGMAEVFLCVRRGARGFAKRVAVKRILPQYTEDPQFVQMFVEEAQLAAGLSHANIVQVFDFGDADGELFIAMEYVEGTNVHRLLRAAASRKVSIPLEVALHIASETAHALDYAHRAKNELGEQLGFVHRDVSPANILLTHNGNVKLTDFGIATVAERSQLTESGHIRGKIGYMSPEQVTGKTLTGQSDIFTLSIILAELIIGEPLFGKAKSDLDLLLRIRDVDLSKLSGREPPIPRDVLTLLKSGLRRSVKKRASAHALRQACQEIARRRSLGHAKERLAQLLQRLSLANSDSVGPGTRHFDTRNLRVAEPILGETSPAIYRVQLKDGSTAGPVSFPKLVEMITSGQLTGDLMISKEAGDFVSAGQLPELTRFISGRGLQWQLAELNEAEDMGKVSVQQTIRLIHDIAAERRTGVLHFWDAARRKKIYFVDGNPEFVASTSRRELLGEYLVENGLCLKMEVDMALALLPRYGGRLGDALIGLAVLRPVELFRAMSEQVRARLLEVFRWRQGEWAFVPNARSHEETFPFGHDSYELLRDAVMQIRAGEIEAVLDPISEQLLRPVSRIALDAFHLPAGWRSALEELDGQTTFAALFARHGKSMGIDLYRATFLGLCCGMIEIDLPSGP